MLIYLKRTIILLICIIFLFLILGNIFFYFYGSNFVSYLSKDLVNIGKVEYSLLPFSVKLKDV
ncbi:MAG: hypothetical protein SVN78_02390, partial [Deferribacterota bacterium]|nr:hypothetical protein [Deferribacterota bacterium]